MGKLLSLKTAQKDRAAIIDEFGDVDKQRKAFAPIEKRYGQLRDEIKSWHDSAPGAEEFTEKGTRWQLDVGTRADVTTVKIYAVFRKLGITKFLKACTVTLKALADFLPEAEIDQLTTVARTGSRNISVTPIVKDAS